ncbi:MAG: hypothetical protein PHH71_03800 [Clostridia bacterium]|jgi:protein involved in ribonucleotide reduction|nr:hypothetical protein [Clostridia bacterium]MDD3231837.1 hypothetical protein [Clostridia bacterium]MDD3862738.1 hypothetical protein [Clostridia bacterium]MDD4408974.1 hypothetical protein [Clostridia bacterium]
MSLQILNLKEHMPTVDIALANLETEIEIAKKFNCRAIKIIHGYGSHGSGGAICIAVKRFLNRLKSQNKICEIIDGSQWTFQNDKVGKFIYSNPDWTMDEDFNRNNPGITVILL